MKNKSMRRSKRLAYLYKKHNQKKIVEKNKNSKSKKKIVKKKMSKKNRTKKQNLKIQQTQKENICHNKIQEEIQEKFDDGNTLDLCLICDCTGSMASWINRAH